MLQLQEQLEQEKKESAVLRSLGMDMKPIQQPFEDELASASVFRGIIEEVKELLVAYFGLKQKSA